MLEWERQLKSSLTDPGDLARRFRQDSEHIGQVARKYPMRITPYYLNLISEPGDPVWKQAVPDMAELDDDTGEEDPLQEDRHSPLPNMIHRYPDRVLWLVSEQCAVYCRFCTRKRRVGCRRGQLFTLDSAVKCKELTPAPMPDGLLREGLKYIQSRTEVRDVILSGGDPLLLADEQLEEILSGLRAIEHVQIIRIGSRTPCVMPMRITAKLVRMLRKYHPLYLNTHFNHPRELTPESRRACARLVDAGIPVGNQSVLLQGVNDDPYVMEELLRGLLVMRVKPYYLYQADPVRGTGHFRTSIDRGLEIISYLRGNVSGLAVPAYVIDAPGGAGKLILAPDPVVSRQDDGLVLRTYDGRVCRYPL
ncbi:MAG: KamA family radical SAM protein [bacterium]|nr:KamA family radical SAM protein [bacterium]